MPEKTGATTGVGASTWGVVVVNWNTPGNTIECLESILEAASRPRRVVLVDNASADDSVAKIADWARLRGVDTEVVEDREPIDPGLGDAWLLIVASRTPRGFSANNNIALRHFRDHESRATHVLLLNSDAVVQRDFFDELAAAVTARPDGGLFTGTIYEYADSNLVWYAGGTINPLRGLASNSTVLPATEAHGETQFVCGCAMLIAMPALRRVGLLDECYDPAYCEDADYSLRVAAAGFALIYSPRAKVRHKIGGTIGPIAQSPEITFSINRNRALMIARNYDGWRRTTGLAYLLVTKPGRALVEAAKGRPRTGWAVLTGMLAGVFGGSRAGP